MVNLPGKTHFSFAATGCIILKSLENIGGNKTSSRNPIPSNEACQHPHINYLNLTKI